MAADWLVGLLDRRERVNFFQTRTPTRLPETVWGRTQTARPPWRSFVAFVVPCLRILRARRGRARLAVVPLGLCFKGWIVQEAASYLSEMWHI